MNNVITAKMRVITSAMVDEMLDQQLIMASVKQFRSFTCYYCNALIASKGSAHNSKCPTVATYINTSTGKLVTVNTASLSDAASESTESTLSAECPCGIHRADCEYHKPEPKKATEHDFEDTVPFP